MLAFREQQLTPALKVKRQWRVPRNNERSSTQPQPIQPGDSGVWATCDKGRERKCIGELRDLFAEYTEALYGVGEIDGADAEKGSMDVESSLQAEIQGLKQPPSALLFAPRQVDVQCGRALRIRRSRQQVDNPIVAFIKTTTPIEPVPFVKQICADAMSNSSRKRTRFVKRLTPMTLTARASEQDLENVARKVLAPHFHRQPAQPRKVSTLGNAQVVVPRRVPLHRRPNTTATVRNPANAAKPQCTNAGRHHQAGRVSRWPWS